MLEANRKFAVRLAALVVIMIIVTAVTGCPGLQQATQTGTVKLQITDGPFPFDLVDKATVTITRIEVCPAAASQPAASQPAEAGEDQEDAQSTLDDDGTTSPEASATQADGEQPEADSLYDAAWAGGHGNGNGQMGGNQQGTYAPSSQPLNIGDWIVVFTGQKEFNLLDLRNGKTDLLADTEIPAGTYTGMRLIVTQGTVTLKDGRTFTLRIPSGAQTGIKLHFTFTVEAGQEKALLLDVNLSRAFKPIPEGHFKQAKEIKGFMFRPSFGMRLINIIQTGSIGGTVTDASQASLANVTVTALQGGTEVVQTSTDAAGTYKLVGLVPGTYQVAFSAEGYVDYQTSDVTVAANQAVESTDATLQAAAPDAQP